MATAARPIRGAVVAYVLEQDRAKPKAQRSVFMLRRCEQQRQRLRAMFDGARDARRPAAERIEAALRVGLVAWLQFTDEHGLPVPFEAVGGVHVRLNGPATVFVDGAPSVGTLQHLKPDDARELAVAFLRVHELDVEAEALASA